MRLESKSIESDDSTRQTLQQGQDWIQASHVFKTKVKQSTLFERTKWETRRLLILKEYCDNWRYNDFTEKVEMVVVLICPDLGGFTPRNPKSPHSSDLLRFIWESFIRQIRYWTSKWSVLRNNSWINWGIYTIGKFSSEKCNRPLPWSKSHSPDFRSMRSIHSNRRWNTENFPLDNSLLKGDSRHFVINSRFGPQFRHQCSDVNR
jgi:hypothetical protein